MQFTPIGLIGCGGRGQFQDVAKRIHAGEIGIVKTADAAYQCSL